MPKLCEHRDQERVGDQDRRQHTQGRADAELGHEVEPEEREAGDRDRDREAREQHGPAGGGAGLGGRVDRRQPFVQVLPEPRDDEERVVDPDADADHRYENRRDRVDVGQPGKNEEEEERRSDGHERQRNRNRSRDERAEDDHEHDERGQEAEQLLYSLLDGRGLGLAVELGGDTRRLDPVADRIFHRNDLRAICGLDRLRELRLGVRDSSVVRECLVGERIADAVDARLAVLGLELRRLELGNGRLDCGLALGRVETLALRRGEDEVQHGALLGGELRLDQVGGLLRVGARNLEHVLEAAADGRHEND